MGGGRYKILEEAVEKLRAAMIPAKASDSIAETIVALHHAVKNLDKAQSLKLFTTIIPRVNTFAKESSEIRFALRSLQKAYDSEVAGKAKSFRDELDWLLKSKSKIVVEIQQLLLKNLDLAQFRHFLFLQSGRSLSFSNIVRNHYLQQLEKPFQEALVLSKDRLAILIKKYTDNNVIPNFQKTGQISEPHFWKLKGEITEMLCKQVKLDYLAEVRKTYPKAQLFENVMAVTMKTREGAKTTTKAPRQIWDGIIAVPSKNGLKILKVFEIKSGLKGFDEALGQVRQTHMNRFVSKGDELHLVLNDGTSMVYKLGDAGKTSIKMDESVNIMLNPAGESWMMPNQIFEDGEMKFITQLIELGKREIDHFDIEALTMDLLMNPQKFLK